MNLEKLVSNNFSGIQFIEEYIVKEGVVCKTYNFLNDNSKDLAIIKIEKGCKTPKQKVLTGKKTVEGILWGSGKLTVKRSSGKIEILDNTCDKREIEVSIGDIMQWKASKEKELVIYEICYPPYKEGRFKNINE